ncbi:hypothetical protein [Simiduia aestuariiviva]|uniref:Uncharacterized protein n=1 Tax=Simiduia aestuariiviva TaxID=1510459 RepID=A0A839UVA8_9GAMM|nr:hypothetical protein [Simiduia aestuariiviva]MBB3169285.1 hypothetical protein [Simiduia aestuariiviva]
MDNLQMVAVPRSDIMVVTPANLNCRLNLLLKPVIGRKHAPLGGPEAFLHLYAGEITVD